MLKSYVEHLCTCTSISLVKPAICLLYATLCWKHEFEP